MALTVAEIGRLAGVSAATVSRAMNNSGAVSSKARQAIQKVLQDTNYDRARRPSIARKSSNSAVEGGELVEIVFHRHSPVEPISVGRGALIIGPLGWLPSSGWQSEGYQLGMSFHRRVVDGAIAELTRWRRKAALQFNSNLMDPHFLKEVNRQDKCGVLLVGEYSKDLQQFTENCRHPLVLVDFIHLGPHDVVTIDNLGGITQAFDHIHGLGHRKIGFIGARTEVEAFHERFVAFKMKMADVGLTVNPDWVYSGFEHIEQAAKGLHPILARPDRPTALVCANDCYALSVIRAASDMGLSIPQELSVIGFDDGDVASMVTPPLTTIRVPQDEMGQRAARQLMLSVQLQPPVSALGCETRVKTSLVVRQSTGPAPGDAKEQKTSPQDHGKHRSMRSSAV
jgi:LacI family transcriptional regulator